MARNFVAGNRIATSAGSLPAVNAYTVVAVFRATTNTSVQYGMRLEGPGVGIRLDSAGTVSVSNNSANVALSPTIPYTTTEGYILVAGSKPAGTSAVRVHKYVFGTDTWTRSNSSSSSVAQPTTAAISTVNIGSLNGASTLLGDIALVAFYADALTDTQISDLPFSLSAWWRLNPAGMWLLDQQDAAQTVADLTGSGANQTSFFSDAPSVSTASLPIFGYGQPVVFATRQGGAPPPQPISSVSDDFNDGIIDPILWAGDQNSVSETGGKATITADTDYNAKATGSVYTFDTVYAQVGPPPAGTSTGGYLDFGVASAGQTAGTDLVFYLDFVAGQLYCSSRVGYFDGTASPVTYDPVAHAWWRIRRTGGNVLWDVSPDGTTWSNLRTLAEPSWVAANPADVSFRAQAHRNDGAGGNATLDNFNTVPAAETGSAAIAMPALSLSGAATAASAAAGSLSLPALAASGTVTAASVAAAPLTLPALQASGAATSAAGGTAAPTLPAFTATGAGTSRTDGTAAVVFPAIAAAGTGTASTQGQANLALPAIAASGAGSAEGAAAGSADLTLSALTAAGSGLASANGSSTINLPGLQAAGTAQSMAVASAALTLPAIQATGSGVAVDGETATAALTLPALTAAGAGHAAAAATAALALPAIQAVGVGAGGQPEGYAAIPLPALTAAANAVSYSTAAGLIALPALQTTGGDTVILTRRPGVHVAGTIRSRLTADVIRGPVHTTGG